MTVAQHASRRVLTVFAIALAAPSLSAQADAALVGEVLAAMPWRALGPSNFGGRIVDIEVDPTRASTWYVAAATGGLWKTVNAGTTFEPLTDSMQSVFSIGDLAIAPSETNVLYLGTGEANNQRSCSWGDGVYRSSDAGRSWQHIGLRGTDHIGRIVVDPRDPDRVFVAAAGALYSPNPQRGLYRTRDAGASWQCVLHLGDDVGCIDVVLDPFDPDVVFAASYERRRRAWDFVESGPGSAIHKSSDGGDTWQRLDGVGLPDGAIGRIGLDVARSRQGTLYAIVENDNPAPRPTIEAEPDENPPEHDTAADELEHYAVSAPGFVPYSDRETDEAPSAADRRRRVGGEVYRSDDHGASWRKHHSDPVGGTPHYYYGQIRVDPNDAERAVVLGIRAWHTQDGGKTWRDDFQTRLHVDSHALWIDPADSRRALIGNDGGLAETRDAGATWRYINGLPLAQFYAIGVDTREPYTIFGGTQDNGTWAMPSRSVTQNPVGHADVRSIGGGDGFYVAVDPDFPDLVYTESQFGALSRYDMVSGRRVGIRPRAPKGTPALRFNWMSPLVVSAHAPATIYFGSQFVHRSRDRGEHWEIISQDLSTADPEKLRGDVPHCTITTLAESPLDGNRLLAGTDDGRVWSSEDGGKSWIEWTERLPDVPARLWVSRVAFSSRDVDTAYVAITGYREDLRGPWLFLTNDGGVTFRSIANDLPRDTSIHVVAEHPRNPAIVLVGHEYGVHASIDSGARWFPLGDKGLPTQPVHDLIVHPRDEDVVIGTHGRGIFVLDGAPLAELDDSRLTGGFFAFRPRDGQLRGRAYQTARYPGAAPWQADHATAAPVFWYLLTDDVDEAVKITVLDAAERTLFTHTGSRDAGCHRVEWQRTGGQRRAREPAAGDYVVVFQHGETKRAFPFRVKPSPVDGDLPTADDAAFETDGEDAEGEAGDAAAADGSLRF